MSKSVYFDVESLDLLCSRHPAWRLLKADSAPFVIAFLHAVFIADQHRQVPESELLRRLDDHLFTIRAQGGADAFPRPARDYLKHWSSDEAGWIRASFIPSDDDDPVYDLTPAAEKAIDWIASLRDRTFVGTESRLLTVIELLRQIRAGTEVDPQARLRDLERRRDELDGEIERVRRGVFAPLTPVAVRDRFQLLAGNARALLSDLREVQQLFHRLDRDVRSRIAQWDGTKGGLLDDILLHRDHIAGSSQGQSFRAFWDFLLAPHRQEEFDQLLDAVLALPAIREDGHDPRLHRIRFDWLAAGEQAQRTVAQLSQQLRRYLDDRAWMENRRIAQLIQNIERQAIAVRADPPSAPVMEVDDWIPDIALPLDRPLFSAVPAPVLAPVAVGLGVSDADDALLYDQHHIDLDLLAGQVQALLARSEAVSLSEVIAAHPLHEGLAELIGYLRLASDQDPLVRCTIDEDRREQVTWIDELGHRRRATIPRIVFLR
jgi:hypothetical protein